MRRLEDFIETFIFHICC